MTSAPEALAEITAALIDNLPPGMTATVFLVGGDEDAFTVASAGSTPPHLLALVLRTALDRLEGGEAVNLRDLDA